MLSLLYNMIKGEKYESKTLATKLQEACAAEVIHVEKYLVDVTEA